MSENKDSAIKQIFIGVSVTVIAALLVNLFGLRDKTVVIVTEILPQPGTEEEEKKKTDKEEKKSSQSKEAESISSSACSSTTTITESNKKSLLREENGRKTLICKGTYCSGTGTYDGELDMDKFNQDAIFAGNEVVYGFKDGSCATFDTFTVAVVTSSSFSDKEFELLVGNDSSTGKFESIGKFKVDGQILSQTFNFEPKTGRYFKVKKLKREFVDSTYRLQLWGALE